MARSRDRAQEISVKQGRTAALAWSLFALCVVGALAQTIFRLLDLAVVPSLADLVEAFGWTLALPVVFSGLAAMIIARQPGNRVGWLLMLPGLGGAVPLDVFFENLSTPPVTLTPGLWLLVWFEGWSWLGPIFPLFLIPLHFPTGRPPSRRWGRVNALAIGMWLFFAVIMAFNDTIMPLDGQWELPNRIGFIPFALVEELFLIVWGIGLVTVLSLSVASLFVRYHQAQDNERQQIKWLLYVGALFVVVYTLAYVLSETEAFSSGAWGGLLFLLSIMSIPSAIAFAILRHNLYDIDIIIRKTLIYSLVTAILAAIYFGGVILTQQLTRIFIGSRGGDFGIVLSTLLIAVLFSPLRRRIQDTVDRRFYRRNYDAEQTLARFNQTLRDEVDIETLQAQLLGVVDETMQPVRIALWIGGSGHSETREQP